MGKHNLTWLFLHIQQSNEAVPVMNKDAFFKGHGSRYLSTISVEFYQEYGHNYSSNGLHSLHKIPNSFFGTLGGGELLRLLIHNDNY